MTSKYLLLLGLLCAALAVSAQEQDTCVHLNEITVTSLTGQSSLRTTPTAITVVSASQLASSQFTNVVDAISRQPGLAQVTTGGGISKPVIRGLGYNRVLVVDRGVRQEGQQWGDEHGVEVDAMSVGSVEIQKGPATLMYGSDAMAGVVILRDSPVMGEGEHRGSLTTEYQTNSGLFDYSLGAEGNHKGLTYNWRWTHKMAHDYKNAVDGYVPGSRFGEKALSGMLGLNRQWGFSRLKLSFYHLTPSIVEGERDEETGELERSDNGKHYTHTLPYQQIHHYKAVSENYVRLGESSLKAIVGYQHNRRQEYEDGDEAGLDFLLHTVNYDLRWAAPQWDGWTTNVGVGGMWQRSANEGDEFLIPAYNLFDFGIFATASRTLGERVHLSGGLRWDHRHLNSHALEDDGELRFEAFSRNFNGLTGSIGAVYNISPNWDLRLNVSRGYRAPNLSELGSNGKHEGTLRYEVGNHDLEPEFSWQADLGTQFASEHVSFEVSLFANRIKNYIYLHGTDLAPIDGDPVYTYSQGDAQLLGGEARVIVHPTHRLHIENSFSCVYSTLLHQPRESRYLPFTPAPRWLASVHYDLPFKTQALQSAFVEADMECNLRQSRIYEVGNTETVTPSYTLFGLSAGTQVYHRGRKLFTLTLSATNLFNRSYQNHLSRLKLVDLHNPGRNITLKLLIPLWQ